MNVSPSLILTMEMEYIVKSRYHRLHFTASQKISGGRGSQQENCQCYLKANRLPYSYRSATGDPLTELIKKLPQPSPSMLKTNSCPRKDGCSCDKIDGFQLLFSLWMLWFHSLVYAKSIRMYCLQQRE